MTNYTIEVANADWAYVGDDILVGDSGPYEVLRVVDRTLAIEPRQPAWWYFVSAILDWLE